MSAALRFLAVAILLWLNVRATLLVLRDDLSERSQKTAQLFLVWLIPVAGALIVLAVHRPEEEPSKKYREAPDPGDDFGMSGRAVKRLSDNADGD